MLFLRGLSRKNRKTSGKRTAVGLFVLDCESLMEFVQSATLQLEHGGNGQHEGKRKICFARFWLKGRCWAQPTASVHAVFPPPMLLPKGRVEGIVFQWLLYIRWGCQHSQIPSFLSLCSLLCVHLQFRSLLSQMILTGFGFMRHVWIELCIACSLWSMQKLYQGTAGWVSNTTLRFEGWYHIFQYKKQVHLIVRCYKMLGTLKTTVSFRGLTRINSKIAEISGFIF